MPLTLSLRNVDSPVQNRDSTKPNFFRDVDMKLRSIFESPLHEFFDSSCLCQCAANDLPYRNFYGAGQTNCLTSSECALKRNCSDFPTVNTSELHGAR
jgi:hypothetical protein